MSYLLEQNPNVAKKDAHGYTALHLAVISKKIDIVELLVTKTKIGLNEVNGEHETPMK